MKRLFPQGRRRRWVTVGVVGSLAAAFAAVALANTISIGPATMEGAITAMPGDWMSLGWHFKYGGSHPASTVVFHNTTFSFAVKCKDGSTPSQNPYVINVPDKTYNVAANDTTYIPWTDQDIASSFQYPGPNAPDSLRVPALCGPGVGIDMSKGTTFFSDVQSTDTKDPVTIQFHYRDANAKGKGNVNCSDPAQNPDPGQASTCGASMSPTQGVVPDPLLHPSITIAKTPDNQTILTGTKAPFHIVVTNDGDTDLTNVVVTDPLAPQCNFTYNGTLAKGASFSFDCQSDTLTANLHNVATVTGTPPNGLPNVTANDDANVVVLHPTIKLVKLTNNTDNDSAPGLLVPKGSAITWSYLVTNTSPDVALTNVAVTDNKGVTVTCPKTTLAIGESMTCTASGTAVVGQYSNIGTVTGKDSVLNTPVTDSNPDNYYGADPSIKIVKKTNGTDNDSPTGPILKLGSTVSWTYIVSNTGNVPLNTVNVTDSKGVAVSCPKTTLGVGESIACTGSGTAVAGQYTNLGSVTAKDALNEPVSDSNPDNYFGADPKIGIVKLTNGTNNDSPTGPVVPAGSTVTWDYLVTNTGNIALSNVGVTDDITGGVTCPKTTLSVGESMTCTKTGIAVPGQYTNIGTASGTDSINETVTASNPDNYFGANPHVTILKQTNNTDNDNPPGVLVAAGSIVHWTYLVTNDGNIALSGVAVTDSKGVQVTCPKNALAQGESMTCTASDTAIAGQYSNVGTVTGKDQTNKTVTASNPDNYFGAAPAITILKTTNGTDNDTPPGPTIPVGNTVTWTYLITNAGNVPLENVAVTDDKLGAITCPGTTLAVGANMICTATGVSLKGQYENTGTATGKDSLGQQVTATNPDHYFGSSSSIAIVKLTNGTDNNVAPGPLVPTGSTVTWTYTITNTSNVALHDVALTDDKLGSVTCPKTALAAGESMTCTATGTALAGQYANLATVTGLDTLNAQVSASNPDHYFGTAPKIGILKETNGTNNDSPTGPIVPVGSTVNWTYTVTNLGNIALSNVSVVDSKGVLVTCPKTTLASGESMVCTASGTALEGQYTNIGTASGTDSINETVTASNPDNYFGQTTGLKIVKLTNGTDNDSPTGPVVPVGSTVTWNYTVTNTGNTTLTNVVVTDDNGTPGNPADDVTVGTLTSLAPGASTSFVHTGIAQAGQYGNVGSVTGTPPTGPPVSATNPDHYFGATPSISIVKKTNGTDNDAAPGPFIPVGSQVTWTYLVENTGNVPLSSVSVSDSQGVTVTCPQSTLAVGESMTCTATGTAVAGQYGNVGTAKGTDSTNTTVTDSNPDHYYGSAPGVSVVKLTNGTNNDSPTGPVVPVGSPITWTYDVTNTGNVTLTNVSVVDDQGVVVTCPKTTLVAGESMTCTATGIAVAGQYTNVGTVVGTPPVGPPVKADNPDNYYGAAPAISLVKKTNGTDNDTAPGPYVPAGSQVTWTYDVKNTGNVALSNVSVVDDHNVAVSCPKTTLAAGETMQCTASGSAQPGQYANLGTASGTDSIGETVTATNPDHYFGAAPQIGIVKLTNGTNNDTAPGPFVPVGSTVTWTYEVTNLGNVPLSNVGVVDDQGVSVSCPQTSLAVGASMTCTASGPAVAGQYTNVGTASGTDVTNTTVHASNPDNYFGQTPGLSIIKQTNDTNNDSPTGPVVPAGSTVTWKYFVTNTGNVTLTNVTVVDDNGTPGNTADDVVVGTVASLAPGAAVDFVHTGIAQAGQYGNVGTVTGTPPTGPPVTADNPDHYFGATPAIGIVKLTNGTDNDAAPGPFIPAGSPVAWTYTVTNLGNVPLSNVGVVDSKGVTVTCPKSTLAVGESMQCTATGTALPGQYENVGTASGTDSTNTTVQASNPDHYFGSAPGVEVVKLTNGSNNDGPTGPVVPVGSTITWTYTVTNTGNVTLTDVVVTDDNGTPANPADDFIVGTIASLAPGASATLTHTGIAQAGQYTNVGTVTGTPPVGPPVKADNPDNYYGAAPAISLVKKTNGTDNDTAPGPYVAVGQPVNWTYDVTNTGNVPLVGVLVTDSKGVLVNCPKAALAVGETMQCTASGIALPGQYENVGTVIGTDETGKTVTANNPDHYFGAAPEIGIVKLTNGANNDVPTGPFVPAGSTVTWTYEVTNLGNVALGNVGVVDDQGVLVTCPFTTLAVGASMTCSASGPAVAGQYTNIGTASGTDVTNTTVTASNPDNYFGETPAIKIVKSPDNQSVPDGGIALFHILVTNTGNVDLGNVTVTDPASPDCNRSLGTLSVGQSVGYDCSSPALSSPLHNVAFVTGNPPVGPPVTDNDFADVTISSFTTAQNLVPNDDATLSGLVNNPNGHLVFSLYKGGCTAANLILGPITVTVNANGTYSTANGTDLKTLLQQAGLPVDTSGTYNWKISYEGDTHGNADIVGACGVEHFTVTNG